MAVVGERTGIHMRMETPNSQAWTRRCGGPPCTMRATRSGQWIAMNVVLNKTKAGTGRASGLMNRATLGWPMVMSASHRGMPRSMSGGITRAMTMCSTM